MWKRIGLVLLLILSISVAHSEGVLAAALNDFVDTTDGYQFSYPNGWVQVKASKPLDVIFHDIIEPTENISVVVSPVPGNKPLSDLGSPTEIGYKLGKNALAPEGSGRVAELVDAAEREVNGIKYYRLEYIINLPNNTKRHNLASVAVSHGKLFTLNASVSERRWPRVKGLIEESVNSFQVY